MAETDPPAHVGGQPIQSQSKSLVQGSLGGDGEAGSMPGLYVFSEKGTYVTY